MYIPKKYNEDDWETQAAIIKAYPLGTVVTTDADGQIIANHIPFFLNIDPETGKKTLQAHFARVNHQVPSLKAGNEVLVIFKSHDSYISPSYYPEKKQTHKFVPTWDFAAIHVYGKSTVIDDFAWVRKQLNNFTDQNEVTREEPWKVEDAPESYLAIKQKAILGLEIEIERVEGKFKFEQKESKANIEGVVEGLSKDGIHEVCTFVKKANDI